MIEETYKLEAVCDNCDYSGEVEIPKGTKVEEMDCPQCGCKELHKVQSFL